MFVAFHVLEGKRSMKIYYRFYTLESRRVSLLGWDSDVVW